MSEKRLKRQHLKKRFLNKNRLVLLNENTFEEILSFKLNLLNVVGGTLTLFFMLIVSTVILMVFTPMKEFIPGYSSTELKENAIELSFKVDSLEQVISKNERYLASLQKVLTGDVAVSKSAIDSLNKVQDLEEQLEQIKPSEKDLKLRELVRLEDKYNVFKEARPKVNSVLFAPLKGSIVKKYDVANKHYALDIASPINTPIKAITKGMVLFSDWTPKDGYSIILLHEEGLISVYKHASSLTKSQGDQVKSGEVIALTGGGIEDSSHFHFELWKDSNPLDPTLFIDFQ